MASAGMSLLQTGLAPGSTSMRHECHADNQEVLIGMLTCSHARMLAVFTTPSELSRFKHISKT